MVRRPLVGQFTLGLTVNTRFCVGATGATTLLLRPYRKTSSTLKPSPLRIAIQSSALTQDRTMSKAVITFTSPESAFAGDAITKTQLNSTGQKTRQFAISFYSSFL